MCILHNVKTNVYLGKYKNILSWLLSKLREGGIKIIQQNSKHIFIVSTFVLNGAKKINCLCRNVLY